MEEVANYVSIKSINPFFRKFAYVDTLNYYADQLFIKNKIKVKFDGEFVKPEEKYILVMCEVRRADEAIFVSTMKELSDKILLCGKNDYYVGCKYIQDIIGRK